MQNMESKTNRINDSNNLPLESDMNISTKNAKHRIPSDSLEKIRYLPSEIKISKSGGKRTASAMCSFQRKQFVVKSKDDIKHRSVSECTDNNGSQEDNSKIKPPSSNSTFSTCSNITFSDIGTDCAHNMDDVMSTISDISDLSVMSFNPSSIEVTRKFRRQKQLLNKSVPHSKENQVIRENIASNQRLFSADQKVRENGMI